MELALSRRAWAYKHGAPYGAREIETEDLAHTINSDFTGCLQAQAATVTIATLNNPFTFRPRSCGARASALPPGFCPAFSRDRNRRGKRKGYFMTIP